MYAGLGLIDTAKLRKNHSDIPTNVIGGWAGSYFGAGLDIELPFKLAWASGECVTDKPGSFFACSLNGGVAASTELFPLSGEVLKGKLVPSDAQTLAVAARVTAPHTIETESFEDKPYHYIQFTGVPRANASRRNEQARAALGMTQVMPTKLARTAGKLALALGVDADMTRERGHGLAELCAGKK